MLLLHVKKERKPIYFFIFHEIKYKLFFNKKLFNLVKQKFV